MTENFYYTALGEREAVEHGHFDRIHGHIAQFAGEILTDGETARAWEQRGYIERKKEYNFIIERPTAEDWTPNSLLQHFADNMELAAYRTKYYVYVVFVQGIPFEYHHIEKMNTRNGFDRLRVYLTEYKGNTERF